MADLILVRQLRTRLHSAQLARRRGTIAVLCCLTAAFVLELTTGAVANDAGLLRLGALPDDGRIGRDYWRLITFGFLHWDFKHLVLNSVLLLLLAPIVERRVSSVWFLLILLSASVVSGVAILCKHQLWPSQGVSLGASGGLFGLLGAALVVGFRFSSQNPTGRKRVIAVLIVGLIYSVLPNVSMIGHVTGLITGTVIALLIPMESPRVAGV